MPRVLFKICMSTFSLRLTMKAPMMVPVKLVMPPNTVAAKTDKIVRKPMSGLMLV